VLVWKDKKLLLIERKRPIFGFAPPAGHVDNKGTFKNAAREELEEEVGLQPIKILLIKEGRKNNPCRRPGGSWHYWKIYKVEARGKLKPSKDEVKQIGWYSRKQIEKLAKRTEQYNAGNISEDNWQKSPGLEPVWYKWFKELKII
jgi:ADP-ribose pyrophosphatase YjhB (NUDIX family)